LVTCKDFLKEMGDYLDEAADPATKKAVEEHIHNCPNCWVIFDTTKKTIHVYKGMDPQPLPEDVHQRLVNVLETKCKKRKA